MLSSFVPTDSQIIGQVYSARTDVIQRLDTSSLVVKQIDYFACGAVLLVD